MKFTVSNSILKSQLSKHAKIARVGKELQILNNIKITAIEKGVQITSSDGVVSYISNIKDNVSIKEIGSVLVDSQKLNSIISKYSNNSAITLSLNKNSLKISDGSSNNSIKCITSTEDYPKIQTAKPYIEFDINSEIIIDAIAKTNKFVYKANKECTKPILECVTFELEDELLLTYALDGYKGAKTESKIDPIDEPQSILIQAIQLQKIMPILKETEDSITIGVTDKIVIFRVDTDYILVKRIEGIPVGITPLLNGIEENIKAYVNTVDLKESLDRAKCVLDENTRLKLEITKDNILLTGIDKNYNSVEENIPINMELGEDITLYVSSERLHEVASAFTEEEMIVKIESDKKPVVFMTEDEVDEYFLSLLSNENKEPSKEEEKSKDKPKTNKPKKEEIAEDKEVIEEQEEEEVETKEIVEDIKEDLAVEEEIQVPELDSDFDE